MKRDIRCKVFVAALVSMSASVEDARADEDCGAYETLMHWVGSVDTPGNARRVAVSGSYAFVADENAGLQILDISAIESPQWIGSVDTPGVATDVAVVGTTVYVAEGALGVHVIDVEHPDAPQIITTIDTPGSAARFDVEGSHLYVADVLDLLVLDVSAPRAPTIVKTVPMPEYHYAYMIAVSGGRAYMPVEGGICIFDVTMPEEAMLVVHHHLSQYYGYPICVDAVGDLACVGWSLDVNHQIVFPVTTIDVADPMNPVLLDSVVGPAYSLVMTPAGIAFAGSPSRVSVIDFKNPSDLRVVGGAGTPAGFGVAIAGNHLLATAGAAGVSVVDIENPRSPPRIGSAANGPYYRLALSGGVVAAITRYGPFGGVYSKIRLVDITSPQIPQVLGEVDLFDASASEVAAQGTWIYVASGAGLIVIDAADPAVPQVAGSVGVGVSAIAVTESAVLMADGSGFHVVDVEDAQGPHIMGSVEGLGAVESVAGSGSLAFAASGTALHVIDISIAESPQVLGSVDTSSPALALAVAGDLVFAGSSSLDVIDVSDPWHPVALGNARMGGSTRQLAVFGSMVFASAGEWGLHCVDVSDPVHPRLVGGIATGASEGVLRTSSHLVAGFGRDLAILPAPCLAATGAPTTSIQSGLSMLAFPNPMTHGVTIRFHSRAPSLTRTSIYDVAGRLVRKVHDGQLDAGTHHFDWNGADAAGQRVAAGVYVIRAESTAGAASERVTVLR